VEIKGSDPRCTWEIVGIYRAPNEDIRVIEKLAARTGFLGNNTTRSIIGGDSHYPKSTGRVSRKVVVLLRHLYTDWFGTTGTHSWLEHRHAGILYWTFTSYDPKVHSYLAVRYEGSVTIAGCN
jgi:hypothetical protein